MGPCLSLGSDLCSAESSAAPGSAGGGSLTEKLKEGLEKYGAIAIVAWSALFFLSWIMFYLFLQSGVDVVVRVLVPRARFTVVL